MILDFTNSDIRESNNTVLNGSYYGGLLIDSIEGKSEQNGTPSPSTPVEIKSVVGKNLLKIYYGGMTENGITFTKNSDGTVTVNGTATANTAYIMSTKGNTLANLPNGKYTLTGCPKGGGISTYRLQFYNYDGTGATKFDDGEGITFDFTKGGTSSYNIAISVKAGTTVNNLVFKPMLRLADNTDDTYVPYGNLSVKTVGKNLLKHRYNGETKNGITFTKNADNSVTVNGTATAKTDYILGSKGTTLANLPNGKYTLTGCPKGGSLSTYRLLCWNYDNTNVSANDLGSGVTFEKTNTVADYNISISIASGATVNNLVFKPMLRPVGTNDTYEPYQCSVVNFTANLHGIGDVKDRIIKKDGLWQIERRFAEVVFDGSNDEEWKTYGTNDSNKYRYYEQSVSAKAGVSTVTSNILCDSYVSTNANASYLATQGVSVDGAGKVFIYDKTYNTSDVTAWKNYLASNPITVVYELAEPTYEVLPPVDQSAINSLLTYNSVTYVSTDSEVNPQINTKYGATRLGGYALLGTTSGEAAKLSSLQVVSFDSTTGVLITKSEVQL